jgi:hypothetical protein
MVKKPAVKKAEVVLMTKEYVNIEFADVIKILTMISEHDQSNKLAAKAKRGRQHLVQIPKDTVNMFKRFVADHPEMSQHPIGKKVMRPTAKMASVGAAPMAARAVTRVSSNVAPKATQATDEKCCNFDSGR